MIKLMLLIRWHWITAIGLGVCALCGDTMQSRKPADVASIAFDGILRDFETPIRATFPLAG